MAAAVAFVIVLGVAVAAALRLQAGGMQPCTIAGRAARCEYFSVPENPGAPGGKKIQLKVAVVKATGAHPKPDPLLWFSGWGGAGVSDDADVVVPLLRRVNIDRDLIFIDQRGTGSSKLVCRMPAGWNSRSASPAALTAAARRCAADIGPNLRFYTSAVAVDDFDRVRQALGYAKVNLYGGSYGVTTGLIYLLRHGSHVRSATFDSGSLLDVHIFERAARGSQRALDLLFKRCAQDTGCSTAYPHLRNEFYRLLARLERKPIRAPGSRLPLTSLSFAGAIGEAISYSSGKNEAPRLIDLIAKGRYAEAVRLARSLASPSMNGELAYKLLIQCSEPWASWRPAEIQRIGAGSYLEPVEAVNAQAMAAVCRGMPKGLAPANIGRRVHSSAPVLFLNGNEDGADPPSNIANARRELPNSRTVVFPRAGHGQLGLLCAQNLIADFIEQGTARGLDTSCVPSAVQQAFDIGS